MTREQIDIEMLSDKDGDSVETLLHTGGTGVDEDAASGVQRDHRFSSELTIAVMWPRTHFLLTADTAIPVWLLGRIRNNGLQSPVGSVASHALWIGAIEIGSDITGRTWFLRYRSKARPTVVAQ